MNTEEKANRFDRIRAKALQLGLAALKAGDQDAMIVVRCCQAPVTPEQARAQRERLKAQTADQLLPKP